MPDLPYLISFTAILLSASLFDRGSGYVATALSGALAAYIYLPNLHSFRGGAGRDLIGLVLFLVVGAAMSAWTCVGLVERRWISWRPFSRTGPGL
jgi:K+-sensing histidine kinase KdpD